ncbi:MAG: hypothetical protein F6K53_41450 [Moorea sp. SIO4A1]|uniref:hypothetical protein n=1 Tax=Moorena sp. SIO4A1 TaxID=2607835 RepID=UPI00144B407D|nr:hypothetical protein [Moorena sp. SIO4A1]NEQ63441.1 hypothetical protein [Moorena sp. SIO4A1]
MSTIAANQDLFVDLNQTDSETVSGGGWERFTVANQTRSVTIPYAVDGKKTRFPKPGQKSVWTTNKGGIISFDYDFRRPGVQRRKYNLSNGRKYAFRLDTRTAYKYDIELFRIG